MPVKKKRKAAVGKPAKRKVAVGKAKTVKRKAPAKKRTVTIRKTVTRTKTQKGTIIQRGQKILAEIDRLEAKRKQQTEKAGKDFYALAINKEHKKLSQLQKNLK
jgi:hypothetical protein